MTQASAFPLETRPHCLPLATRVTGGKTLSPQAHGARCLPCRPSPSCDQGTPQQGCAGRTEGSRFSQLHVQHRIQTAGCVTHATTTTPELEGPPLSNTGLPSLSSGLHCPSPGVAPRASPTSCPPCPISRRARLRLAGGPPQTFQALPPGTSFLLSWLMGVQVNEMELSPAFFKLWVN